MVAGAQHGGGAGHELLVFDGFAQLSGAGVGEAQNDNFRRHAPGISTARTNSRLLKKHGLTADGMGDKKAAEWRLVRGGGEGLR